jgi:hypothetical protein
MPRPAYLLEMVTLRQRQRPGADGLSVQDPIASRCPSCRRFLSVRAVRCSDCGARRCHEIVLPAGLLLLLLGLFTT